MKKLSFSAILLCAVLLAVVCPAFADLTTLRIAPVAAYAPNHTGKEYERNAINGGGLNEATGMHSTAKENATWRSDGAPTWFVMDLGRVYIVSGIKIWNYNGSNAVNSSLRQIDILFSTADDAYSAGVDFDNGKWVEVVTDTELAKAPNNANYTGCDPIVLSVPQSARFIAFRIDSTWGNANGGLSEVRVDVVRSVSMDSASVSSTTAATLSGTMATTDTANGEVFLAYGDTNGGTNVLAWSSVVSCGVRSPGESFSKVLDNLTPGKSYVGSFYVYDHSVAANWSAVTNFITGVVSVTMPPAFCEAETAAKHIVFSRPASCAAEALEVVYSLSGDGAGDYATALPGSIVFAAGATEAAVAFSPVKDTTSSSDKTLTVTVQPGLYLTDATSSGSVTILDTSSVTASNPSWTSDAGTMDWDTAGNWSSSAVPNYLDTVTIDTACSSESPVRISSGDHSVVKVSLGSAAGGTGALEIALGENSSFYASSGLSVGAYGEGSLKISDGTVVSLGDNMYIGSKSGAYGSVTVDGNLSIASGKALYVGNSGDGRFCLDGGSVSIPSSTSGNLLVGYTSTGKGVLVVNGGDISVGHTLTIGASGSGIYTNKAGSVYSDRVGSFAQNANSSALVSLEGGNITIARELAIGDGGSCLMDISGGTLRSRGTTLGSASTGEGVVYLRSNGSMTISDNSTLTVGGSGSGKFYMRGGVLSPVSSSISLVVRNAATGYGLLSGWGTITVNSSKSSKLTNNGLVIADGLDDDGTMAERALSISIQMEPFVNSIENDSTNGWYAVNKGLLSVAHPTFSLVVGDSGVCTWGEAESDDQIDLVNSARVTFTNITTAVSAFTGKLYASDRSDVPALPGGKTPVGVWKFDITGDYESAEVEFRYDHVLAKKGVQMYQLDADGTTWTKLETELLDGYRAKVSVTDATRMFAATERSGGIMIFIR